MASDGDASIGPEQFHSLRRKADVMVEWDPVETDGVPSARKGSALAVWNGQPLLFGGDGGRGVRFNDVFVLDTGMCIYMWWGVGGRGWGLGWGW